MREVAGPGADDAFEFGIIRTLGQWPGEAHLFGEIMREAGYNMWSEWLPYEAEKYPH